MKLTKLERHMAYLIMLAEAEDPSEWYCVNSGMMRLSNDCGLCRMFKVIFEYENIYQFMKEILPELHTKITDDIWPFYNEVGWQSRIALLKQCIEETADAWPK